jgi:hypothetical protein
MRWDHLRLDDAGRSSALTTPAVTDPARPSGLPTATTGGGPPIRSGNAMWVIEDVIRSAGPGHGQAQETSHSPVSTLTTPCLAASMTASRWECTPSLLSTLCT